MSCISPFQFDKSATVAVTSPPLHPELPEEVRADGERVDKSVMLRDQSGGGGDVKHISTTEAEIERARRSMLGVSAYGFP